MLGELFPTRTLGSVERQTRKSRLYLVACARRLWPHLPGVLHAIVQLAELCTDNIREYDSVRQSTAMIASSLMQSQGTRLDLQAACEELANFQLLQHLDCQQTPDASREPALNATAWRSLAALVYLPFEPNTPPYSWVLREHHSVVLLREVFHNPWKMPTIQPDWRTETVNTLARTMYASRDFSAMPILADALQDAGCDDDDILDHCRAPGEHVRGCWVVDLVLSKR
jgi:hypothetical protein